MANPTAKVELSLADPGVTPVWIDISPYVIDDGITTNRGRNSELDRFQAGKATVQLNNNDRRFDPTYTAIKNLLTNPSAENNLVTYQASAATLSRSSLAAQFGSWSILVATTNVQFSGITMEAAAPEVVAGLVYTWSLYARLELAGIHNITLYIDWYNSGSYISTVSTPISLTSTTFARFWLSANAPVGATHARLFLETPVASGVWSFYTDGWQFEQAGGPNTYCDGDQPGCTWDGAAHDSQSRAGGPYWPNLRPLNRLKISGIQNGVTYPVLTGYVEGWTPSYQSRGMSVVDVSLNDGLSVLANTKLNMSTGDNPRNLITNPGFEEDLTGYFAEGSASIGRAGDAATVGGAGLLITTAALANSGVHYDQSFLTGLTPGDIYTFSLSAALNQLLATTWSLRIDWYNGGTFLSGMNKTIVIGTTEFARHAVTGIAPAGADRAQLILRTASAQGILFARTDDWLFEPTAGPSYNLANLPNERSDERIRRVLIAVGWPSSERSLSVGASTLLPQEELANAGALPYIQTVEQTERGRFWVDRAGTAKFLSRWDLAQSPYTTSVATFGPTAPDLQYVSVVPSHDLTFVRNEIRLTSIREGAVDQVAVDPVSQGHYYNQPMEESGLLVGDNELADAADYLLDRYKDVHLRFLTLELAGMLDPANLWPVILGLELSDRVTVKFQPFGPTQLIVQDCFVEGIKHNWTKSDLWRTTLSLSSYGIGYEIYPSGKTFFVLGTSALTTGTGVLVY